MFYYEDKFEKETNDDDTREDSYNLFTEFIENSFLKTDSENEIIDDKVDI